MKELIGHSENLYLVTNAKEDRLIPMVELIMLASEPRYEADIGGFVKTRAVIDLRFSVSPKALRDMAEQFVTLADEADEVAAKFNPAAAS